MVCAVPECDREEIGQPQRWQRSQAPLRSATRASASALPDHRAFYQTDCCSWASYNPCDAPIVVFLRRFPSVSVCSHETLAQPENLRPEFTNTNRPTFSLTDGVLLSQLVCH